jgi:hypothetical protein
LLGHGGADRSHVLLGNDTAPARFRCA